MFHRNSSKSVVALLVSASMIGSLGVSATPLSKVKNTKEDSTEIITTSEQAKTYEELIEYYNTLNALDKARAKSWRLSEKEYGRYKLLKETSPRAIWTPSIDPITLLGAEARTEQERVKYARLFNQIELERTEKDIAFGVAQNEDLKRLSPNSNGFKSYLEQRKERRINYMNMNSMSQGSPDSNSEYQTTSYILYVDLMRECGKQCSEQVAKAIEMGRVDFFFINASSDNEIIEFARKHSIPSKKVKSGVFTFNYANEDKTPLMPTPVLIQKVTGNNDAVRVLL
ncbi:MAG: hypothetical protein P8I03_15140 [Thalassotalea sp.]|nr:hypothetical protein [Thalassotalea sp.]